MAASIYQVPPGVTAPGNVLVEMLSSFMGAVVEGQASSLGPSFTALRLVLAWRPRTAEERASKKPLNETDKFIIRFLRWYENNGDMPYAQIADLTGFPKVTISRVLHELNDRQLAGHVELAVVSRGEEGQWLVNVQYPQGTHLCIGIDRLSPFTVIITAHLITGLIP